MGELKYDTARSELIPFVPAETRALLDVGCGSGRFGAELRSNRPGLRLWAVEPDPMLAAAAQQSYDRVIPATFDSALGKLPTGGFDVVVFADVLEHIVEPGAALEAAKRLLRPRGVVLASIPNVRHYAVLKPLILYGEWRYEEVGLLDRTHLRFFTRTSIANLFEQTGYRVRLIEGINLTTQRAKVSLSPKLRALRQVTHRLDDFFFLQFVVIAEPT